MGLLYPVSVETSAYTRSTIILSKCVPILQKHVWFETLADNLVEGSPDPGKTSNNSKLLMLQEKADFLQVCFLGYMQTFLRGDRGLICLSLTKMGSAGDERTSGCFRQVPALCEICFMLHVLASMIMIDLSQHLKHCHIYLSFSCSKWNSVWQNESQIAK